MNSSSQKWSTIDIPYLSQDWTLKLIFEFITFCYKHTYSFLFRWSGNGPRFSEHGPRQVITWFSWKEILLSSEKVDVFENQESEWISKQLCINYTVRDLVQTFAPFAREAPFWNLLVLYGLCPNSFRPPSVKQANVGKKSAQTILASPPLCFRIGGAEDNFIFYIEDCLFFAPLKKLRRD